MVLPAVGQPVPSVTRPSLDGRARSLAPPEGAGATLLAFFKVTCPTCRLLFPYLARYHHRYASPEVGFLGVSQDGPEETAAFLDACGVSFPVVLDGEEAGYPASSSYGVVTVPALLLVDPRGVVLAGGAGFVRTDLEALADRLGTMTGRARDPLWREGEDIPERRPG